MPGGRVGRLAFASIAMEGDIRTPVVSAVLIHYRDPFRQRPHKSSAASGQVGSSNLKPELSNRVGTTRRLFRTSSVSVLITNVPISSTHRGAGKPKPTPDAARSTRMNSELANGFGEARLTGPFRSEWSISQ
jgi:hypothetical protein